MALAMAERNGGNVNDFAKRDEYSDRYDAAIPFSQALVLRRVFAHEDGLGGVYTNVPHLVVHHSPDGFEAVLEQIPQNRRRVLYSPAFLVSTYYHETKEVKSHAKSQ
jgi:hypothetical protein